MIGAEDTPQAMPPPKEASLLEMVQLSMVGEASDATTIPPPWEEAKLLEGHLHYLCLIMMQQ